MPLPIILLDTHILIWILTRSRELKALTWASEGYQWTVSPISVLEMKFLLEKRRVDVELAGVLDEMKRDERFTIDNVTLEELCAAAMDLSWTRDPFDRLLVAHSIVRKIPFGTSDRNIRKHFSNVL